MNSHLRKDLDALKVRLLKVGTAVEENMRKGIRSLSEMSPQLAEEVIKRDIYIDKAEVDAEEECLKILALHQPVASDLRFVITVLKINGELEHIGDTAVNISRRIAFIYSENRVTIPFDAGTMTSRVIYMLRTAIDAFLKNDAKLALEVCRDDEIVDDINRKCYMEVRRRILEDPVSAISLINYLMVCKSFERMADLCTNIAEDVIYMRYSIIARHNMREAARVIEADLS